MVPVESMRSRSSRSDMATSIPNVVGFVTKRGERFRNRRGKSGSPGFAWVGTGEQRAPGHVAEPRRPLSISFTTRRPAGSKGMRHPFLSRPFPLSSARVLLRLVAGGALVVQLACSSDPQRAADAGVTPVGTDADASIDAASNVGDGGTDATDAADAAAACTDLTNDGAVVRPTVVDGPLPTATGGVVPGGRSTLVAVRYYGADVVVSPTETWQEAARFEGSRFAIVFRRNGGVEQRTSGELAFRGTTVTTTATCPTADVARDAQYSAVGDTFWVIDAKDARVLEFQRTGP